MAEIQEWCHAKSGKCLEAPLWIEEVHRYQAGSKDNSSCMAAFLVALLQDSERIAELQEMAKDIQLAPSPKYEFCSTHKRFACKDCI